MIVLNSYSPRPGGGLVDYDDDEDDDDFNYKPPPRKQSEAVEEDDGAFLKLKRKPFQKEKDSEKMKKQRPGKNSKTKDGVFAALCSTLSQAVLPNKNAASSHSRSRPIEGNTSSEHESPKETDENASRSSTDDGSSSLDEGNQTEKQSISPKKCSDPIHKPSDNRQLSGDDCSLIPPNSSPEMTVNGS